MSLIYCVWVKRKTLRNCLFFFLFFCLPYTGLPNCKSVFLILKIWQYVRSRRWVQHFRRYPCKIWYKNWYLHFYTTYDHHIRQARTSARLYSNETNQVGAGDAITSRSRNKLKALYLYYHRAYALKLGKTVTYLDAVLPIKSHDPLTRSLARSRDKLKPISTIRVPMAIKLGRMVTYFNGLLTIKSQYPLITWHIKTILSSLQQCLWPPNLAEW